VESALIYGRSNVEKNSLTLSAPVPAPDFGYAPIAPKRVLWKWSLAVTAAILLFLMWQCGSGLRDGGRLADTAVRRFHSLLNNGQYEEICREADKGFSQRERQDELVRLLEAVHRKLGDTSVESRMNISVNATTGETFIMTDYDTKFAQGQATETFTWIKSGRSLKLYEYTIQSKALLN
jgi:hypothetical protein